jgi:acetylornithine deacetylase
LITPTEQRALDSIDIDKLVPMVCDLVAIESTSGRETPAQEFVAAQLAAVGMEVDLWELDIDTLRHDPAYSAEVERTDALGVVGSTGKGDGPWLILNGHVDVVPAGKRDRWSVDPWRGTVRNGRIYGRGSVDMKGPLCCAIAAVGALRDAGISLEGRAMIQSVVGEEDGGIGTLAAIRRGYRGDAAIVLEPTELVVAPAQAGAFNFRVTVPGLSAHGALRSEGVSAIDKFIPVYRALQALEQRRNSRPRHPMFEGAELPYAICVGTLNAGDWASTVPESLVFEGRLGIAVDEDHAQARRELVDAVAGAAADDAWLREHPPVVEWWGGQFAPAAISPQHPLVGTIVGACTDLTGNAPPMRGMPFGADMRLLVNEGATPSVLFGPGDIRRAHAPDEFVTIPELEMATRALVLTIMRFAGVSTR